MKKIFILLLLPIFFISVVGCGNETAKKENKKEEFYNEVLKALWGYLCDKLAIPQSELNKDNLEIELQKHNLREELIASFIGILNECEFAQYALGESLQDRDKLFAETTKIIMLLEENIKK